MTYCLIWEGMGKMDSISTGRSIGEYSGKRVSDDLVKKLLQSAIASSSAGNRQPWEFIVVRDRNRLIEITQVHQYSQMLKEADVAIMICGDESREKDDGYWIQDCATITENILIAAEELGLGAVWLGVYPNEDRVESIKNIFNIPQSVIPLAIVSIGYHVEDKEPASRYIEDKIHYDIW